MKTLIIIVFSILFGIKLFAQNEVHLKSGEVLDCKVKSLTNGDLIANFKGNVIHLKIADVTIIAFNKSEPKIDTIKPSIKPIVEPIKPIEKGEIKGVVTYYFNANSGDKPDIGAEVLIYKKRDFSENDYLFMSYRHGKTFWNAYKSDLNFKGDIYKTKEENKKAEEENKKDMDNIMAELKKYNVYPEDRFSQLEDSLRKLIENIRNRNSTIITSVDGSGNYSAKLIEGCYGLIFISKQHYGDFGDGTTIIKSNETSTESYEFR